MSGLRERHLVGGAAAACAVCCAAPVIGFLGVAGFAATAVTFAFAGVVFAIAVGIAAVAAVLIRRSPARRASSEVPEATEPVLMHFGPTRASDSGATSQSTSGGGERTRGG